MSCHLQGGGGEKDEWGDEDEEGDGLEQGGGGVGIALRG